MRLTLLVFLIFVGSMLTGCSALSNWQTYYKSGLAFKEAGRRDAAQAMFEQAIANAECFGVPEDQYQCAEHELIGCSLERRDFQKARILAEQVCTRANPRSIEAAREDLDHVYRSQLTTDFAHVQVGTSADRLGRDALKARGRQNALQLFQLRRQAYPAKSKEVAYSLSVLSYWEMQAADFAWAQKHEEESISILRQNKELALQLNNEEWWLALLYMKEHEPHKAQDVCESILARKVAAPAPEWLDQPLFDELALYAGLTRGTAKEAQAREFYAKLKGRTMAGHPINDDSFEWLLSQYDREKDNCERI